MSAATATRPSTGHSRSVRVAVRHLLTTQLYLAVWFWGIVLVGASVGIVLVDRFGHLENSVVQFARQGGIWFPFSLMVIVATTYVTTHVAVGMTRRSFADAALVATLVMTAVHAVVMTVLVQVERAVYAGAGWTHALTDSGLAPSGTQPVHLLGDYLLTFGTGMLSGLLVGIVYYRAGGWWGTLALPLTVGPVLVVNGLLASDAGPFDMAWLAEDAGLGTQAGGLLVRGVLCLVIAVALGAAFHRLARAATIAPVST